MLKHRTLSVVLPAFMFLVSAVYHIRISCFFIDSHIYLAILFSFYFIIPNAG